MLLYLTSRIISSTGAFLYPTYASYKTLSRRPASEAELERWLMYWSVLGTIVGVEYVAEWTISWIPFYHPLKTLFLLYLALPQTRGASYIYTTHLHPLLSSHEAEIDAGLGRVKEEVYRWVQQRARGLWDQVASNVTHEGEGVPPAVGGAMGSGARAQTGAAAQPTLIDPVSGPAQLAYGFWRSYGPTIMASGAAFLQPKPTSPSQSQAQPSTSSLPDTPPGPSSMISGPSTRAQPPPGETRGATSAVDVHAQDAGAILARRHALEAELASLPLPNPYDRDAPAPAFPIPQPASSSYLPAFGDERGRYEEIGRDEVEGDENGEHAAGGRPEAGARRTSWWWGRADGYERVKTE